MQKQILTILTIFLTSNAFCQITYEAGYFINNRGFRTEGLIKNTDWMSNPSYFLFKPAYNQQPVKLTIDSIAEFGITGLSRYVRKSVRIDRSSEIIGEMSVNREPDFREEVLFLKVVVDGKQRLYEYIAARNLKRYFIESDSSDIEQLIYKSYLFDNKLIGQNNDFRKQLWLHLKCDAVSQAMIEKTDYDRNSLTRLFVKFNQCDHSESILFGKKSGFDAFNLTFKPGFNFSTVEIGNAVYFLKSRSTGIKPGFQIGFETEFILPFKKNKWAVFVEPHFLSLEIDEGKEWGDIGVNYHSIELPLGLRHYFFPGKNSKIFIGGSVVINRPFKSEIKVQPQRNLEVHTNVNASFSLGYNFKNRYSMEITAGTRRDLLVNQMSWFAYYHCISFGLGYTIL